MKQMRVKETADLLGVKSSSVRLLEKRGMLRAVRDWSGHRRFKEADVLKLKKAVFGTK
jgi:excisionase family DNA binding protein